MDQFESAYESYRARQTADQQAAPSGKEEIIAVRRNEEDNIIAVKTNTGRELDYPTALSEAKAGNLAHVDVFHKYGRDILRSEPDGIKENNLSELPDF
ncbi:DUF3892 domain-containing protein [Bacillus sp. FSL H8-0515]|uniref:DUF3892 domain-containing protein n=1 Tax=Bacillus sp. FSL H8-0515 TaxID=2921396 RepID=UPI00227E6E19|nr:DUF3892 domain-containing protein [Bacillus sp. S20C3]MCY8204487.1 DUF3892 domain-containing protein [Bacillus sp. N12A5]MCY8288471.1 DUF3892 domain-containing protein [Bacillus sp. N13C7]MCY8640158.1 DUF3892 domain-containing protein [Bacillus sp. S17B2]MCY8719377.1 DUF3892 domain-containing protein [Bacillus sp. S10C12M]MCY9142520.1 DUF3892 domain-containing protein [Bacillus sp. T9C1]